MKLMKPRWKCIQGDEGTASPGTHSIFTWREYRMVHEDGNWTVKLDSTRIVAESTFNKVKAAFRYWLANNKGVSSTSEQTIGTPGDTNPPMREKIRSENTSSAAPSVSAFKQLDNLPSILEKGGDPDERAKAVREWMWLRHARHLVLRKDQTLQRLTDYDTWKDILALEIPEDLKTMDYMVWQQHIDSPKIQDMDALVEKARAACSEEQPQDDE